MQIAVTRRIHADVLDELGKQCEVRLWDSDLPPSAEELLQLLDGADGALTLLTDRIDDAVLDRLPALRAISNLAVGYDNIDVAACTRHGVAACTTPDVLTRTTAEFTLALIFAVARQIVPAARAARAGDWQTWYPMRFLGRDLADAMLGIVGLGRIGREVAALGRACGLRVIYSDEVTATTDFERVSFAELLDSADIVSLHVPLTAQTQGLLGADALRHMRRDAILINTSRGPVVDTDALVAALRDGRLFGVGLDVTDPEPLPPDHPLYTFERVTIVPHIASASVATRHRMSQLAAENLIASLTGGDPPHCLNPEVLQRG
jgi:glyoxylate reductase